MRSLARAAATGDQPSILEEPLMSFINEAGWDRVLRVILGIALLCVGWGGFVTGALGTVFRFLGFLPPVTGLVGWCPAYSIFRIRTNKAQ
jgi:hypothetical protein